MSGDVLAAVLAVPVVIGAWAACQLAVELYRGLRRHLQEWIYLHDAKREYGRLRDSRSLTADSTLTGEAKTGTASRLRVFPSRPQPTRPMWD